MLQLSEINLWSRQHFQLKNGKLFRRCILALRLRDIGVFGGLSFRVQFFENETVIVAV